MVRRILLVVVAGLALAAGAHAVIVRSPADSMPPAPQTASATAQPPPEVGIVVVQPQEVSYPMEYAGRIAGFGDVEVRPRVGGLLISREFKEGARVEQGQVLFRIDPAAYEAALSRAEAQLQQAEAAFRQAEENFNRTEELFRRGVSTDLLLNEARALRDRSQAGLQRAQAEVLSARQNVSDTTVIAPASGTTALQSPPVGTLVQPQQTLLTTISQPDPASVIFSFSDEESRAFRALNEGRETRVTERDLKVELLFSQEGSYPHLGRIDMAAQRVDPQTGTIQARALFPNPDGALQPGQFVRVRLTGMTLPNAIVVPHQAVSQGPQGPSVFVLGENDDAQPRPIRLGPELAEGWVIREGLTEGERVVAEGVTHVRPGQIVRPVPAEPLAAQTTASSTADALGAQP